MGRTLTETLDLPFIGPTIGRKRRMLTSVSSGIQHHWSNSFINERVGERLVSEIPLTIHMLRLLDVSAASPYQRKTRHMAAGHEPENHSKGSCSQLLDIDLSIKSQAPATVDLEYLTDHTAAGFGRKQIFRFSTKLTGLWSMTVSENPLCIDRLVGIDL